MGDIGVEAMVWYRASRLSVASPVLNACPCIHPKKQVLVLDTTLSSSLEPTVVLLNSAPSCNFMMDWRVVSRALAWKETRCHGLPFLEDGRRIRWVRKQGNGRST